MNVEQLQTFLAAAASLSFTSAARQRYISQPAVSQQIRDLEEHLGVTLFERRGRGLLLTPAGIALQQLVAPILRQLKEAEAQMAAFQGLAQGILRVGASPTPGVYLLPHAIGRFSTRYPGVHVSLSVMRSDLLVQHALEGELDVVITEQEVSPARMRGWNAQALLSDQVVLIARPDHPWAQTGPIRADQLLEQPMILRQKMSATRQLIMDHLALAGVDPEKLKVRFELGHSEAIIHAVMAGLGVGFVSRFAVASERGAGLIGEIPIEGVQIERKVWLLRPQRAFVHQERFCELLTGEDWLP